MRLKIIGSAAGGGFPQWNCNYRLSRGAWDHEPALKARTQSSLAASVNSEDWVLFNASPDIRQQIANTLELQPRRNGALRASPIRAVVLTNADVDHIAGLLSLRERQPFVIYATRRVLDVLAANSIFNVLDSSLVERRELPVSGTTKIRDAEGAAIGITVESFVVPGKVALFLEDPAQSARGFGTQEGDTIGLRIFSESGAASVFYIPGCARVDETLRARLKDATCLLFDGTLYTDDEMIVAGVGPKSGERMGHMHISGNDGSVAALAGLDIERRIYVHINNTNPILDDSSAEHAAVRKSGWEIAEDGMEVNLD